MLYSVVSPVPGMDPLVPEVANFQTPLSLQDPAQTLEPLWYPAAEPILLTITLMYTSDCTLKDTPKHSEPLLWSLQLLPPQTQRPWDLWSYSCCWLKSPDTRAHGTKFPAPGKIFRNGVYWEDKIDSLKFSLPLIAEGSSWHLLMPPTFPKAMITSHWLKEGSGWWPTWGHGLRLPCDPPGEEPPQGLLLLWWGCWRSPNHHCSSFGFTDMCL